MLSAKYIHINMDKNKRPKLYTLPDTLCRQSSPCTATVHPVRSVWYRVQTGAACPASGRVCVLLWAWSALPSVLCSLSGCAGVGRGTPAGYIAAAQPRPVSLPTTEKIKKAQKPPHPHCQSSKFSAKTKRPLQRV